MEIKTELSEADYLQLDVLCKCVDTGEAPEGYATEFFKVGPDECAVMQTNTSAIVVVGGSGKDYKEWSGNKNAYYGPIDKAMGKPEGRKGFHYDFYMQAERLMVEVNKRVAHKNLVFTGVSRGAAIVRLAHMQVNTSDESTLSMSVLFDPPRSFTWLCGWRWYRKNKKCTDICHRITTFLSDQFLVGALPPAVLGWVHRQSTLLRLPNVWGKLNHIAITEGLNKKFKKRGRR